MRALKGLRFILRSRGIKRGLRRALSVGQRFGVSADRQIRCIGHYASVLARNNVKGTFFIPATLMERYSGYLKKINSDAIEWGIHSDVHTDLSGLGAEAQREHIHNAVEIFQRLNISFGGFRAPYLRINDSTQEVVCGEDRILYDSSSSVLWDEVYNNESDSYGWARNFYNPRLHSQGPSLPEIFKGLVHIPVTLPDDDMLLDRDGLNSHAVSSIWKEILKLCCEGKEIFILQLHPERIYDLDTALEDLIKEAKAHNPPVWIATLTEVARWHKGNDSKDRWPNPYQAALCITGDIDSIAISDFFKRLIKW